MCIIIIIRRLGDLNGGGILKLSWLERIEKEEMF